MDTEEPRLDLISAIGSQDSYLAVVSTLRSDGSPHSSLVNAAVVAHPVTGAQVGAFVTYGPVKLAHLRRRPALTLTWRSGWSWVSLDGTAQLAGPHDRLPGFDPDHLPGLLRAIFTAGGRAAPRLGHLRPHHGRTEPCRRPDQPDPGLHQRLLRTSGLCHVAARRPCGGGPARPGRGESRHPRPSSRAMTDGPRVH